MPHTFNDNMTVYLLIPVDNMTLYIVDSCGASAFCVITLH